MTSSPDAFGQFVTQPSGILAAEDEGAEEALRSASRMISASPSLLARERQLLARHTEALALVLRAETGAEPDDLRPWVVASTLVGLHGMLIGYVRRRLLEGDVDLSHLAGALRREGGRAIELLGEGLHAYAVRPGPGDGGTPGRPDR